MLQLFVNTFGRIFISEQGGLMKTKDIIGTKELEDKKGREKFRNYFD